MKTKDMKQLKAGDFIEHKHFGLCYVGEVMENETGFWALVIRPLTSQGIALLRHWSGGYGNATLEDKNRLILQKVDNPIIPKLVFELTNNLYTVAQWKDDELGVVKITEKGDTRDILYACVKVAEFTTSDEAHAYVNEDIEIQKLAIKARLCGAISLIEKVEDLDIVKDIAQAVGKDELARSIEDHEELYVIGGTAYTHLYKEALQIALEMHQDTTCPTPDILRLADKL